MENQEWRTREGDERAAKLSLVARKKELRNLGRDMRKEISKLEGLLAEKRVLEMVVEATPKKTVPTEIFPTTPMTRISPIPCRLGRKRGGGQSKWSRSLLEKVEVERGQKIKVEKDVGLLIENEKERGIGPMMGLKVGGVAWLVGVHSGLAELGRMGFVICECSRWLVNDEGSGRRMKPGKTWSSVGALV